jgi:hypothetical protein
LRYKSFDDPMEEMYHKLHKKLLIKSDTQSNWISYHKLFMNCCIRIIKIREKLKLTKKFFKRSFYQTIKKLSEICFCSVFNNKKYIVKKYNKYKYIFRKTKHLFKSFD